MTAYLHRLADIAPIFAAYLIAGTALIAASVTITLRILRNELWSDIEPTSTTHRARHLASSSASSSGPASSSGASPGCGRRDQHG